MIFVNEYDIEEAFASIEEQLIKSMMRNMQRHRIEELTEGKEWSMWQTEQLKALAMYRTANQKKFQKQFAYINRSIEDAINSARKNGYMDQEVEILEAIKKGFTPSSFGGILDMSGEFFRINNRKMDALINATKADLQKAEHAMLRMSEDKYRQVIFNAQAYVNSGAATYEQAVDMATKDYLSSGINCVEYTNGARVNIGSYAAMALRTANKRAYLTGEGEKRKEWGITTVIMNKRGAACLKCLPFVGKIFIDDVWSGGSSADGDYPLLSSAIARGLYHPNCRDSHTTYFEGITEPPLVTHDQIERAKQEYIDEQKVNYAKKQTEKFARLADNSLDEDNQNKYKYKENEWRYRSKEYESSNKGILRNTVINRNTINGSVYTRKIESLGESIDITRKILNESRNILYHRSGTKYEDLVFINSKSGEVLRSVDYEKNSEAKPTKKMFKMLKRTDNGEIIAIHNHPSSMHPSLNDLVVAEQRGYKYGLIACHNGDVYKYEIAAEVNRPMAISALAMMEEKGYNNNVLDMFRDAGVKLEVL